MAVSTFCKKCNTHFKMEGGKAISIPEPPKLSVVPGSPEAVSKTPPAPAKPAAPAPKKAAKPEEKKVTPPASQKKEAKAPPQKPKHQIQAPPIVQEKPPEPEPEINDERHIFKPKETPQSDSASAKPKKSGEERLAVCFECGDSHMANALANSTQCRKCGRLISLANHEIKGQWSSRIQTRGDVLIGKKGSISGTTVQCHNLTVEGNLTAGVDCSGDLTIRRNGKIMGKVRCRRLLIEKRAKVEFSNSVEAQECVIDGLVTGDIVTTGKLSLEKKATLTGNIKVGTLTVKEGAKHNGQIQMGG